jgi:hypothetical protein
VRDVTEYIEVACFLRGRKEVETGNPVFEEGPEWVTAAHRSAVEPGSWLH